MTEVFKGFSRGMAQWLWNLRQGIRPVEPANDAGTREIRFRRKSVQEIIKPSG
jgi:hypothetical protein